jgi:hypothetical protein
MATRPTTLNADWQPTPWQSRLIDLIPFLVGFALTRRFNLHGWRSLLVYVLAAGTTRQVIAVVETKVTRPESHANGSQGNQYQNQYQKDAAAYTQKAAPETRLFKVIHTTPGRLRLRVPVLSDRPDYAQAVQKTLESDRNIHTVRVNPVTASVTIQFDIQQLSVATIRQRLTELLRARA